MTYAKGERIPSAILHFLLWCSLLLRCTTSQTTMSTSLILVLRRAWGTVRRSKFRHQYAMFHLKLLRRSFPRTLMWCRKGTWWCLLTNDVRRKRHLTFRVTLEMRRQLGHRRDVRRIDVRMARIQDFLAATFLRD